MHSMWYSLTQKHKDGSNEPPLANIFKLELEVNIEFSPELIGFNSRIALFLGNILV
jgi:hypothetical protein